MEYYIITSTEEFKALKFDWERIENLSPEVSFFSIFENCFTWWKLHQKYTEDRLWIICIYHNKKIIGIAPFYLSKQNSLFGKYTKLMFLDSRGYNTIMVSPNAEVKAFKIYNKIIQIIFENKHQWDELFLTHISYKDPLSGFLLKSRYNPYFNYLIENPVINLNKFKNFSSYAVEYLPAKTKQYANRLKRLTDYSLKITDENMFKKFAKIHISEKNFLHDLGRYQRHSLFENSIKSNFIENLYLKGLTTSYFLFDNINENIIIYNYGSIFRNTFYSINTAFDPSYAKLGVGKILYYEIFKENYKNPRWEIFDTGTGRYSWKFEWTSDFNLLYQLHYIKPTSRKLKLLVKFKKLKQVINF